MARKGRSRGKSNKNSKGGHNKWNKQNENEQSGDGRTGGKGDTYVTMVTTGGNYKMECYYALQGLHNYRWNDDNTLEECTNDFEKNNERLLWRNCIADVLPSSFRIKKDVPIKLLNQLEAQLHNLLNQATSDTAAAAAAVSTTTTATTNILEDDNDSETKVTNNVDIIHSKDDPTITATDSNSATTTNNKKVYADLPKDPNDIIKKLPFDKMNAYQIQCDKTTIRKHPALRKLHEWLIQQTDAGYITRQETVSMIPPIVLNIQPTDVCLDMCAAPGSKTSQMLEVLGNGSDSTGGCIVANDNNPQRAYMLVHQLKRINSDHPVVLITSCDAQFFPSLRHKQYTKILCDVPCTGDGTSRKNIGVWRSWNSVAAYSMHTLQYNIAWKGLSQLLQVTDGYMCYSTCSLNPIENEAVVANLLRQSNGCVELVDCRALLSSKFKTRPGMSQWKVLIEAKSRKQMKNIRNKNNATMQHRRKLHSTTDATTTPNDESKNAAEPMVEDDSDIIIDDDGGKTQMVKKDGDVNANEEENIDEYTVDQERMFGQIFNPSKMDEKSLFDMAINGAGLQFFNNYEEVLAASSSSSGQQQQQLYIDRVKPSCFSPTPEECSKFHLDRCIRCLPHDNDTGGFFVALLRKIQPISSIDRRNSHDQNNGITATTTIDSDNTIDKNDSNDSGEDVMKDNKQHANEGSPDVKRRRIAESEEDSKQQRTDEDIHKDDENDEVAAMEGNGVCDNKATADGNDDGEKVKDTTIRQRGRNVSTGGVKSNLMDGSTNVGNDDCVPVPDAILNPLIEYYGLNRATFPRSQYMQRACATETKVIYYVSKPIQKLIDLGLQKRVTIIHTGLRGFARNNRSNIDEEVKYRVCQEGIHYLLPHMTKRKFYVNETDFRTSLASPGKTMHVSIFSKEFADQIKALSAGAFVIVLDGSSDTGASADSEQLSTGDPTTTCNVDPSGGVLAVVMWKCRGDSIDSLVAKVEIDGILSMLNAMKGTSLSSSSKEL